MVRVSLGLSAPPPVQGPTAAAAAQPADLMMHSMAVAAALRLLALAVVKSMLDGLPHILVFDLRSIAGMAALSALIAAALTYSTQALTYGPEIVRLGVHRVGCDDPIM